MQTCDQIMLASGHAEYAIAEIPSDEEQAIALRQRYSYLPECSTKEGYEAHRVAIGELVKLRTKIEKRRKELKAEYLEKGRRIDAFAKNWTEVIEEIESPLRIEKQAVDDAKEAEKRRIQEEAKRAEEEAARQRLAAEEAKLKAIRDAEEERLRAERERLAAERAKVEAELRAERERLAAERAIVEAAQRAEQKRLAQRAEQVKIEEEKRRIERIGFERLAKIKAEKEAAEQVERQRVEAERAAKAKAEAERKERERIEALRPDVEMIRSFAAQLRNVPIPAVKNEACRMEITEAMKRINLIAQQLEKWRP